MEDKTMTTGISTGYEKLDTLTDGFHNGEIIGDEQNNVLEQKELMR
jgi:replicative DNA helicase